MENKTLTAAVIDTETAGFNGPVIELCVATVFFEQNKLIMDLAWDERYGLPEGVRIDPGAAAAHNIVPEDIAGRSLYTPAVLPKVDIVIGHNVSFDVRMLGVNFTHEICTLKLARNKYPGGKHDLTTMMYRLFGVNARTRSMVVDAHSASADVVNCLSLLNFILQEHPEVTSFEQLLELQEAFRIPSVMPGEGKYGGQHFSRIPPDYRLWYRTKCKNPLPEILEAFVKYPFVPGSQL